MKWTEYCDKKAKEMYDEEKRNDGLYNDEGDMYESVPIEFFRGGFLCAIQYIAQNENPNRELSVKDVVEILKIYDDILENGNTIDRSQVGIEMCCKKTAELFNDKT